MKDMAGSGKPPCGLACGGAINGHSTAFNVMLLLILISLVAFAAVLISDILSFKSNASSEDSFSVFSFLSSKESGVVMKDHQEDAAKLADQGNDLGPVSTLENAMTNNSSRKDMGMHSDPAGSKNSSLSNMSNSTLQPARTAVTVSKLSDSEPNKSTRKKKHSSSKNSIQANQNGASSSSAAAESKSQLNQSHSDTSLSSNLSQNTSVSALKLNEKQTPSNVSHPEGTGNSSVIPSNDSVNTNASLQLAVNSTITSNSGTLDGDTATAANSSSELEAGELDYTDNVTSDLDTDASAGPENETQVEQSVQVELPLQELSGENSMPNNSEDLGQDNADPVEVGDSTLPLDGVSSDPQQPEHSTETDRKWPVNSQEEPTSLASSQDDRSVKGDSDLAKPTGKVVPADKSSKWNRAKDKRVINRAENKRAINRDNRDKAVKRDKTEKSLKRPTPPPRPARPKPVRPARDGSED